MEEMQYEALWGYISHQKKKTIAKLHPGAQIETSMECLFNRAILEGSKGGSWKSIGRFAYQPFVIRTATRNTRAQQAHCYLWQKRRKLEIVCTCASTHRHSFCLGQGARRFTNGFDEAP
jgi:hypothetical protein